MDPNLIREIQHYLRTLSFRDNRLYPIAVDGIYGNQTTEAVKAFQLISGLPVTGDVDSATWNQLFAAYEALTGRDVLPVEVFPHPVHVIRPNDQNELVAFLQVMLNTLSKLYGNIGAVPVSGIYDPATVKEIRNLQALHALDTNGIVDLATWNTLATLFNDRYRANNSM